MSESNASYLAVLLSATSTSTLIAFSLNQIVYIRILKVNEEIEEIDQLISSVSEK